MAHDSHASEDPCRPDTYCGIYCGACDWMMATRDYEAACKVPGAQPTPPELLCHGCKTDLLPGWCASCEIRACARGKAVEFCFECKEYPCAKLVAFRDDGHAHHAWGVRQQEVIRQEGKDAWLAEQHKRWTCPNCGKSFGYYARKCKECGQALRDCRAEL